MQIRLFFLLAVSAQFFAASLQAQVPVVSASASPGRIVVGDPVLLTLSVQNVPEGTALRWPVIPDSLGVLQIVERGRIDTAFAGGAVAYTQRITLSGYDSVLTAVPQFQFSYSDNAGTHTLSTNSIPILVETVPVDTTKPPRPPKDIIPVAEPGSYLLKAVIAGALLLLLVAFLILRKRLKAFLKRRVKQHAVPAHVMQSAAQKALSLLEELAREGLTEKGLHETYFTRLTLILRDYIKTAYRIPAIEMTTQQILRQAADNDVLKAHLSLLEHVLVTADPAKFAKAAPTREESNDAMQDTRRLITITGAEGKRHG